MASLYTTDEAVLAFLGSARRRALLDRDNDGSADTGLIDTYIQHVGDLIDAKLAQRYGTGSPLFAQITDTPATPGPIQRLAIHYVLYLLYAHFQPTGTDAAIWKGETDDLINGLIDGRYDVDVARAEAGEGRVIAVYEAEEPTFAGLDDDDVSRLRGI